VVLAAGLTFALFPSAGFGTLQPTISSDQPDYTAGSLVKLDGANWTGDSTVTVVVDDATGHTWQHTADVSVASNGTIHDEFTLPLNFIANYSVTATGDQTGGVATTSFTDAAGANLDQCANGDFSSSNTDCPPGGATDGDWQNGDLQSNNSHYREGDSVPFREVFSGLSGSNTITIAWQATNAPAQHAYDYLTTWNRTVSTANPCEGVSGCVVGSPSSTFAIPSDPTLGAGCGFTGSQIAGVFTMWGGTITAVSAYGLSGCAPTSANTNNSITISFTASVPNPVLAWGGHIGSAIDWGQGHSASAISGSPYHMYQDDCSFHCGAQDRALKASGVLPEPTIVTQVSSTTAIVGSTSITDQATLTGPNGTVTGSVKFYVCGPTGGSTPCVSGGTLVGTKTLSGGVATSDGFTPSAAGTYCFRVEYTPDAGAQYSPSVSSVTTNECFSTSAKNVPSIATTLSATSGTAPLTVHDSATLSNETSDAGGHVKYVYYTSLSDCTAAGNNYTTPGGNLISTVLVTNGSVPDSADVSNLAAGTYYFRAWYQGDAKNDPASSACADEKLTVTNAPSIATTLSATSGTAPLTVHDSATLSNETSDAGGTVKYRYYSTLASCNNAGNNYTTPGGTSAGDKTVSGGVVPDSNTVTLAAGTYYFRAWYSGDAKNDGASSACADEVVTVMAASTTVTVVHNSAHQVVTSALIGSTVHDKVTVSGGAGTPTGTVDFKVWLGNTTCSGTPSATETGDTLNASGSFDGALPETVPMGGLSYKAHYNGSTTYNPSDGACESLVGAFNALTPGYWKNHLANSSSKGPFYSTDCKNVSKYGGGCSTQGPWAIQYLPKSLGNYPVDSSGGTGAIIKAASIFQAMNCSISGDQNAIGCLAGHLLATKLNLANGSPAFPCILMTVANADAFLSGQTVNGVPGINYIGPSGKYTLTAAQRALAISLKTTMDNYNNSSLSC
jgi:hypothetical protein